MGFLLDLMALTATLWVAAPAFVEQRRDHDRQGADKTINPISYGQP